MAYSEELVPLLNCTIRFSTPEGEYEGHVLKVIPSAETVIVGKCILLPSRRLGSLNFRFNELANIRVICRPDNPQEYRVVEKDVSPVYAKTEIEKLFDFSGCSDIEEEKQEAVYEIKPAPHLAKFVPRDVAVIDSFNKDFSLAIKHIKEQKEIGVSLEGVEISRSGTLTWLCVSTPCCNFLFDILAMGEQAFKKGLKSILENAGIQKILHDCRLASDCLYHKYGVRLVNVFDTQVADFIAVMQMSEREKVTDRVNALDACLHYYLEVPYDYLYGPAKFSSNKDRLNYYALRPLQHEIQDVLINRVMYLHLLKRELELALLTPLRRSTDIYLNCVQKLNEKELLVMQHKPDELPPDIHLEGIQIFRFREFEYMCSTAAAGPPYRHIDNPMQNYLNYRAEYKNGQKKDKESIVNKHALQISDVTSSGLHDKALVNQPKEGDVYSTDRSSESDQGYSDDSEKKLSLRSRKNSNTSKRKKIIVKSEAAKFNESPTVRKYSMAHGLLELLSKTSKGTLKKVKSTSDESRPVNKDCVPSVDIEPSIKDSSNADKLSYSKCSNPQNGNAVAKVETTQVRHPTIGRKSPSELLELVSGRGLLKESEISSEHSAKKDVATSISACKNSGKDDATKIICLKNISNVEPVQMNDPVVMKNEDLSDLDLEEVAERVRSRGAALLRKSASDKTSTSEPLRSAEIKTKEIGETCAENLESTSEDVTVYYGDMIDEPSQMVVKLKQKRSCLADLYKEAGDGNLLWSEDNSESLPKSNVCTSPYNSNDSMNSDRFWAAVRKDLPCKPIDEKFRLRLIPAGMSGY